GDRRLTFADYEALGSVESAIGTRAENVFEALDAEVQATLPYVFRELVELDERGTATRQRAPLKRFEDDQDARTLIRRFTDARLLTATQSADGAVIEVAHEALLRSWPQLAEWLQLNRDDILFQNILRQYVQVWLQHERSA